MPSSQAKTLMTAQKYLQYFCKLAQLQVQWTSLFSWLSVLVFCWTTAVWLPRRCATAHHTFLSAAQWGFYSVHMFKHHFVVSLSKVWGAHMRSRNTFRVIVSMFCSKSTFFFFQNAPHTSLWLVSESSQRTVLYLRFHSLHILHQQEAFYWAMCSMKWLKNQHRSKINTVEDTQFLLAISTRKHLPLLGQNYRA